MNREPPRTPLWLVGPALLVLAAIVGLWHLVELLVVVVEGCALSPIVVTLPIRAESVANLREGWAARHRRAKAHRRTAWAMLRAAAPTCAIDGRIAVTITRIAPRPLDSHDNLRSSTKAAADGIADWLQLKDNDERIDWAYAQERGSPKHYAVRVEIRAGA